MSSSVSPAPSFASSTEAAVLPEASGCPSSPGPVPSAPVSPAFSAASSIVPRAEIATATPADQRVQNLPIHESLAEPSVNRGGRARGRGRGSAKAQPKRSARPRRSVSVTSVQMEHFEDRIPAAGTLHDTSTHGGFQIRTARIALTYARCPIALESCFRQLASVSSTIRGMRGVVEPHQDGTPHVHIIVQKSNTAIPYRNLILEEGGLLYRWDVRTLSTKRYQVNWHHYCSKFSEPSHWGDYDVPVLKAAKSSVDLVATAVNAGIPEALQEFIEGGGALQHVHGVRRGLEIMTASETTTRFVPPPLSLVLRPWQQYLWTKLNEVPKVRRIFWAWGCPGPGRRHSPGTWSRSTKGVLSISVPVWICQDVFMPIAGKRL